MAQVRLQRLAATLPRGQVSVPKQISTGDRTILGKISKRGNPIAPMPGGNVRA